MTDIGKQTDFSKSGKRSVFFHLQLMRLNAGRSIRETIQNKKQAHPDKERVMQYKNNYDNINQK